MSHRSKFFGSEDEPPRGPGTAVDFARFVRQARSPRYNDGGPSPDMPPRGPRARYRVDWKRKELVAGWLLFFGLVGYITWSHYWPGEAPLVAAANAPARDIPPPPLAPAAAPAAPVDEVTQLKQQLAQLEQRLAQPSASANASPTPQAGHEGAPGDHTTVPPTPVGDHDGWFWLPVLPKASNGDDMKPTGCAHWMHTPNCAGKRPTYSAALPALGDMDLAKNHHDPDVGQSDTQIEVNPPQATPVPRQPQPRYHAVTCRDGLKLDSQSGRCIHLAYCPQNGRMWVDYSEPPVPSRSLNDEGTGFRGPPGQHYGEPPRTYEAVEREEYTWNGKLIGGPCPDPRAHYNRVGFCVYDHSNDYR